MSEHEGQQQQEYEFIMEGITTRMQMAMDKLSDANKAFRAIVRFVCIFSVIMTFMGIAGVLICNRIWIDHVNNLRHEMHVSEVVAGEEIPQLGSGADD